MTAGRNLDPNIWSATAFQRDDGRMSVGGIAVDELVHQFGTPLQIFDEQHLRDRCREFRSAVPEARLYYAAKAFLSRAVVRIVAEEGLGVDVCTGGELAVVLAAGLPADRVVFHGNNKSKEELTQAVAARVGVVVIDSFDEISRLVEVTRRLGRRQSVLIRVTPGVSAHTHEYIATAHDDQKFGFPLSSGAAREAIGHVSVEDTLDLRGLHCHIGSQIFELTGYEIAASRVLDAYAAARDELGVVMHDVNLGGGFGIAYTAADDPCPAPQTAAALDELIAKMAAERGLPEIRVSFEPGRSLIGGAMCTVYEVGTVKAVPGHRTYVAVDGGMSDNIRTALYGAEYTPVLANRASQAAMITGRIVGKHCESGDIIVRDADVPADVRPGDLVAVAATGAYCRSLASNYNHVPRPAVVAVKEGRARLIIRRESIDDLMSLDIDR